MAMKSFSFDPVAIGTFANAAWNAPMFIGDHIPFPGIPHFSRPPSNEEESEKGRE